MDSGSAPLTPSAVSAFEAGRAARKRGDTAQAIVHFREAIRLEPDHVPARNNLANALQDQGELVEAVVIAREALALAPDKAILHNNLGGLLQREGELELAIEAFNNAVRLQPDLYLAHYNLAKAHAAQGHFTPAEAAFKNAMQLKPGLAEIRLECGQLYHHFGFVPQATACYRAALRIAPSAQAYNALGAALQDWGNIRLAKQCYRRALRLKPDFDLPHFNLAQLQENLGNLDAANHHYQRMLDSDGDSAKPRLLLEMVRRKQADWSDYDAHLSALRDAIEEHLQDEQAEPLAVLSALAFPLPPAWLRELAAQSSRQQAQLAQALASPFDYPQEVSPDRLRIGYLSPDFRCHAVGTLVAGLFQYHRRTEFEVFAYSLTPVEDAWTAQVREGCDHYHDVSKEPALNVARRIHADGIHILIDLAGYTTHSRPLVLALKPAPVQILYLGYPGTMGADFVPYLLADRHLIPEAHAARYAEQVVYLPQAWASTPWVIDPATPKRSDCGLPEDGMVYCCFNGIHKIEPEVFSLWMCILQQVSGSVLWLSDGGTSGSNERLRQSAEAAGIAPERLVFAERRPHAEYLASYRLADLFLDTPAYNAGATAVGALAAGLPLLTCPGEHYASRMGASLCQAVGLPELICATPDAYVELAVALGRDPQRLSALKERLQQNLPEAPLFQPQAFVDSLETVYRQLWQDQVASTTDQGQTS